jgi:hypothetical protein
MTHLSTLWSMMETTYLLYTLKVLFFYISDLDLAYLGVACLGVAFPSRGRGVARRGVACRGVMIV